MDNRLKELREEKGFTQEDLAALVNVSRQTIISLERGKYNPSIILAGKLARIFGRLIEEIFIFDNEGEDLDV